MIRPSYRILSFISFQNSMSERYIPAKSLISIWITEPNHVFGHRSLLSLYMWTDIIIVIVSFFFPVVWQVTDWVAAWRGRLERVGLRAFPECPPHVPSSHALSCTPQVSVPPGALDCWVFLSCLEVLQRIEGCCDRAQIDSNIAHTVGLWSYATEKVTAPTCRRGHCLWALPLTGGWTKLFEEVFTQSLHGF